MVTPIGQRDQRLSIMASSIEVNSINEQVETWVLLYKRWGKAVEGQGREYLKGGQIGDQKRVAFVIPFNPEVTTRHRILWRERSYEIVDVTGTRQLGEMWLHCQSLQEA
jgi:SPP1 family predicted phage head-tail adaptor